ncbi:hypothetical protein [Brevibacillus migulae]|uniref:hypothetical protein n=1 Tax=Brevibacillus migulae TaxID=1644114 RepID=UPI00106EBF67|nr:hypothetical protein [Brevibacillus migulae]
MTKKLVAMSTCVLLTVVLGNVSSAYSPNNPTAQTNGMFIPNAKPSDWKEIKKLPLPRSDEWKPHVIPLKNTVKK